ncbi:hypothetical protein XELAEV_18016972mg [Xenopus laevis]|uniref:GIY-YIG domain-containing protein n=1 Tax=Xenopus laevis TaxID=8355 RepID=A0A974HRY4_XENLA|nr:hypothetical protein XELAEV_18016972mg [Xenopus laevis]
MEEVALLKREDLLPANESVKKSNKRVPFVSKYVKHMHQKENKQRSLFLNCVCCASIIKGDSIDHPTQGTKIKLHDYATCDSKGVIYMLKCPCGLVYVGQTARIKEHKGDICNLKQDTYTDTAVSRHFNTVKHTHGQLQWSVLAVVQPLSRGGNFKQKMLQREVNWILKLNS